MPMKNNGFTLIELLILILIIMQAFAVYVRATNPEWSVSFDKNYPYFGIAGLTALLGCMAVAWFKKRQYGYLSFAFIFISIGWLVKIFGQST
jgi:hypothetical protein